MAQNKRCETRSIILVIDDKDTNRKSIKASSEREYGARYVVNAVPTIDAAFDVVPQADCSRVAIVALDLDLGNSGGPETTVRSIRDLRQRFNNARILAYSTVQLDAQLRVAARRECPDRVCLVEDLDAVITEILLEGELRDLVVTSPLVNRILQTINIGISIESRDKKLVWANLTTLKACGIGSLQEIVGVECWRAYHSFDKRMIGCSPCKGICLLDTAEELITRHSREGVTDWREHEALRDSHNVMLLPLRRAHGSLRIARVEVDSSVFLNEAGTSLLALIEASRFTTLEWETNTNANVRIQQVMEAARDMTQYSDGFAGCPAIAIYYRPESAGNWHLFHCVLGRNVRREALRLVRADASQAFSNVAERRQPDVYMTDVPDQAAHYLWVPPQRPEVAEVLVDVRLPRGTVEKALVEVLDQDLAPYWRYAADNFAEAMVARDEGRETAANAAVREFMAITAERSAQIGDVQEVAARRRELILTTVDLIKKSFRPIGCHIRVLDRQTNSLAKAGGFGFWYDITDNHRYLEQPFHGSSEVAATRKPRIILQPDVDNMARGVHGGLSTQQKEELRKTSAFITLPLLFSGRIMGTLTLQFDDDSLMTKGIENAVKAIGDGLAGALARLNLADERYRMADFFRKLDASMFEEPAPRTADAEHPMLRQVTDTLFELTHAEFVSYYTYDKTAHCYRHSAFSTQVNRPEDRRLTDTLSDNVGLIGEATKKGVTQFAEDYHDLKWTSIRQPLVDSIPLGPQRDLCVSIACLIVAPVRIAGQPEGALIVQSRIANWLNNQDRAITEEFAFKVAHCLQAMRTKAQLDQELSARTSLADFHRGLVRASDPESLDQLFLLTVTAGECLGFSRAILFLSDDSGATFTVRGAVGEVELEAQQEAWKEAQALSYAEKIDCALDPGKRANQCGMMNEAHTIVLQKEQEPSLFAALEAQDVIIRRLNSDHPFLNTDLRCLLIPPGRRDVEYAVVRLTTPPNIAGILVVDRSFLPHPTITEAEESLLRMLSREFTLMLNAVEALSRTAAGAARFSAWQTLSGRTAHKLGNLLTAADGALGRAGEAEPGAECQTALSDLQADLRGVRRIVVEYRKFAANDPCVPVSTDMKPILERLVRQFGATRESAQIELSLPPGDLQWHVDSARMAEAVGELLENALAFSEHIALAANASRDTLRITVRDHGPGIPHDQKSRIFEPFQSNRPEGSGLGLAIVRQIVENHHGTITECGEPGQGACFVIEIPKQPIKEVNP